MEFGLYTPLQHNSLPDVFAPRFAEDSPFRLALDTVRAADGAGFGVTLVAQRYLGPDLEAWVLAGALAQATLNIRIMPAFHPTIWSPQLVAKMTATLDHVSCGRAALNLVTGWWGEELQTFGALVLEEEAKYSRAEEFVDVLRRLWAESQVTYRGRHFTLDEARVPLKPRGSPPPIFGASRAERGLDMVARCCDWWFAPCPSDFRVADENLRRVNRRIRDMTERAERFGRTLRFAAQGFVIWDEDEAAAVRLTEAIESDGRKGDAIGRLQAGALGMGFIGSRSRILDRILQAREAGVEMLLLKFTDYPDGVRAFGDEIISRLQ